MTNQAIKRIGFACKYMHHDQTISKKLLEEKQRHRTERSTTITWLNNQKRDVAEERLWEIMAHNFQAAYNLVKYVGGLPDELRMVRLGSNQLPAYTESDWSYFWRKPDVRQVAERGYAKVGDLARSLDVRLSFHPAQFCVLASENPGVVENSILEFEYHCDLIRYMGYGKTFQDFKCNVHVGGKLGPAGIRSALRRLSPVARNCLTIENAEFTWGLDASLELIDTCALVLDVHHHWINSGEYIEPTDQRFKRVCDSWRGVRPVIHYSVSREDVLVAHNPTMRPNLQELKYYGFTAAKLRAHSDYYWNQAVNSWALTFSPHADIMCESKQKNLASTPLAQQLTLK